MRQIMPHRNNIVPRPGKCKIFLNHPVRIAGGCGKYITLRPTGGGSAEAGQRRKIIPNNSLHANLPARRSSASAKLECQICK